MSSASSLPTYDIATVTIMGGDRDMQGNSLCFVYRLPTETLETIFIHCACDYYYHSTYPALPVPTWVNVSYVSRRWRHVALNCPTLWTYLVITSPRWIEEFLARSRQAPLKLCVHHHNERAVRHVKQVLNHVERIQELRLYYCNRDVLSSLTSRAPCLQHLEISLVNIHDRSDWYWQPFGGDTPALRTLALSRCPAPWYSFKLSGLTTLKLSNIPVQFQQRMEDFLTTLGCMQDLTYLRLDMAIAGTASFLSSAAFHTFQKFDLPHLSRFEIFAEPSTVAALLSCVNIPLKAELRLSSAVGDRSSSPDHYTLLCSLLAQRFSMSEDEETLYGQRLRTLLISFTQWGDADIAFSTLEHCFNANSLPFKRIVWDSHFPLQITHHIHYVTTYSWERIISHTCCPIPLSNIRSLYVSRPTCIYSRTFWTHVLGHLPGLRYLNLRNGSMPAIAPLLSLAPHDFTEIQGGRSDLGRNQVFAPDLEELVLENIEFSTALQTDMPDELKAADLRSLHDALSTRKDSRIRLTMIRCTERDSDGQEREIPMTVAMTSAIVSSFA